MSGISRSRRRRSRSPAFNLAITAVSVWWSVMVGLVAGTAVAALLSLTLGRSAHAIEAAPAEPATVSVCFTPPAGCVERIVEAIDSARREVLVQAYGFTSPPILRALVAAHRRGVDVRIILDKVNATERYSGVNFVSDAGISVWIDDQFAIAHSKIIVIDRALVVTGSFNFTRSAETRNVEDTLLISSPMVAARFVANWQSRLAGSPTNA